MFLSGIHAPLRYETQQPMKRELQLAALLACAALLAGALLLAQAEGFTFAAEWFITSCMFASFVWLQCWRRRALNRAAPNTALYPTLGWANRITLVRGVLIAACGGFLLPANTVLSLGWIGGPLYSIAAILDRIDGYVARRSGQTTMLGIEFDTVVDALGMMVAPLLALSLGKIHWTYLLVSAAYYLFQLGLYWRRRRGLPVYPLIPNKLRRALAGFQMGFIAVVLWPPFLAPMTVVIGIAFMVPLLLGFCVDWLVVSGKIQPQSPSAAGIFGNIALFSTTCFQPALRLLLLMALLMFSHFSNLAVPTQPSVLWSATALNYALGISAAMVVLGLGGRIGALVMLGLLAWYFPAASLDSAMGAVIVSAVWILLLGCGRYSLWQDDDRWVTRYDGT
jgi:CDP-diacylglycerol---glycerol-3-phosphate 3-phosphatidyltransferase